MTSICSVPLVASAFSNLATFHLFLAQATDETINQPAAPSPLVGVVGLIIGVIMVVALWKVFTKAGQPGWGAIVPIYNAYLLCKIAGKPGWWLLLFIIPFVNFIMIIIVTLGIAKNFGKGVGFALGLIFLSFIFYPILAFGDARYQGALAPAVI